MTSINFPVTQIRLPFNHDYFLQLSKLLSNFYAFHLTNFCHYRKKEIWTCRSRKSSSILQPFKIDQCFTMKEWFITRLAKNTVKGQNRAHLAELCSSKTRCSPNGLRIPGASHESVLLFLFFASEMGWGMKVEAIFVPESPCPTEILQLLLKPAISWEKSSQKRRRKRKERYITRWSTKPPLETTDLLFFTFQPFGATESEGWSVEIYRTREVGDERKRMETGRCTSNRGKRFFRFFPTGGWSAKSVTVSSSRFFRDRGKLAQHCKLENCDRRNFSDVWRKRLENENLVEEKDVFF